MLIKNIFCNSALEQERYRNGWQGGLLHRVLTSVFFVNDDENDDENILNYRRRD